MKQFNLEEYLQNPDRKVVTRDGRNVRIMCTNVKQGTDMGDDTPVPVFALIDNGEEIGECGFYYPSDGKFLRTDRRHSNDLFFADGEEELTEFERAVADLIYTDCDSIEEIEIKKDAARLLELAKGELKTQLRFSSDMHGYEYGVGYEQGMEDALKHQSRNDYMKHCNKIDAIEQSYIQGKADALKDVPKLTKIKPSDDKIYIGLNGWYITEEDFMKLPKEE